MKTEEINQLFKQFETAASYLEEIECWSARDLQILLGYKKWEMQIPENRPVADFLPTISIKAKDLAAEMTSLNVQSNNIHGQKPIENEHIDNNEAVRSMLIERGIVPENLPPAEDVKKVQRKLSMEEKKLSKNSK